MTTPIPPRARALVLVVVLGGASACARPSRWLALQEPTREEVEILLETGRASTLSPRALTAREFRLLEYLMRSAGRICGRMMIIEKVWEYNFDPGTNVVDVYVRKLREKIEEPGESKLLHSVRGAGYMIKEP